MVGDSYNSNHNNNKNSKSGSSLTFNQLSTQRQQRACQASNDATRRALTQSVECCKSHTAECCTCATATQLTTKRSVVIETTSDVDHMHAAARCT
ncbi:unnamed protein product, partial [Ceratitis capitata]